METNVSGNSRGNCQQSLSELLSAINESETNIRDQIALINRQVAAEENVDHFAILATITSRVGDNIDNFRSGNSRQVFAALFDIFAAVAQFIPLAGPLVSSVFKLLYLIIRPRSNIGALVDGVINEALRNFEDQALRSMAYGTRRTFCVAIAYLSDMDGGSDMNPWEISPMIQLTIFSGVEFLAVLGRKLKGYTLNGGEHEKAMAFIKLYCELSSLRYSVLYEMYCIARSTGYTNNTARSIMSVINDAKEEDARLLHFLSQPGIENILFFSVVNLFDDRWLTVNRFMDFIGLEFQNLSMLTEGEYQISPEAWPRKNLTVNMLRIVESRTYLRESGAIIFTATEEENVFFITTRKYPYCRFYMANDKCGFIRGTQNDKDGADRWKVIRLQDGTYMFSTRKWPNWFMYMVDTHIGWARESRIILSSGLKSYILSTISLLNPQEREEGTKEDMYSIHKVSDE
ncbi:hypothetical protein KUTeg_016255 [Tegillarca granosa]|uniref:Uncharacterized protein n=1 Tax=Tegillarca granosa TaxID=220873 RepID=A0ABQ9EQ75_TEGGR|nr:hypothetical protein KUTeg_016255 [Tegillarca granosa]